MQHWTHLVVVNPALTHVIARRTAAGWLLPFLRSEARERMIVPGERLLATLQVNGRVAHEALCAMSDERKAIHTYMAVVSSSPAPGEPFAWFDLDDVIHTIPAMLEEQACAVRHTSARLAAPTAPFDAFHVGDDVREWVEQCVRAESRQFGGLAARYRYTRWDWVQRFDVSDGSVYFKGGRSNRLMAECDVTQALARLHPHVFARTIGLDQARGWWLADGVTGPTLYFHPFSRREIRAVGEQVARVQQAVNEQTSALDSLAAHSIRLSDMQAFTDELRGRLLDAPPDDVFVQELLPLVPGWCEQALELFASPPAPASWVHTDLMTPNIILSPSGPAFIDLEDPALAPPHLSLWRLAVELHEKGTEASSWVAELASGYLDAWPEGTQRQRMCRALHHLPAAGSMLDAFISYRRAQRHEALEGVPMPPAWVRRVLLRPLRDMLAAQRLGWLS